MRNSVSERLNEALHIRNMKQVELVEKTGIDKGSISSYLTGRYEPKMGAISKMAEALNVSTVWLAGFDVPMTEATNYDKESGILTIPFIGQKISAGYGEDELPPECLERKEIDILAPLAKGHEPSKLVAAEVKGDSMIEANIFPGDIVIFHRGLIEGAGIYVLSMVDEVLVKRLEFNPFARELRIISENAKYEPLTVSIDMEGLRIIGKVVSWIHYEY